MYLADRPSLTLLQARLRGLRGVTGDLNPVCEPEMRQKKSAQKIFPVAT
jgi:hypothetical protein